MCFVPVFPTIIAVWYNKILLPYIVSVHILPLFCPFDKVTLLLFPDLLTIEDHTPSPEPLKYDKKGGDWYNQDDMVIKDGPQGEGKI